MYGYVALSPVTLLGPCLIAYFQIDYLFYILPIH